MSDNSKDNKFGIKIDPSQEGMEEFISNVAAYRGYAKVEGLMNWMIPKLISCDFQERVAIMSYYPNKQLANPTGTDLHGGMITSYLDTAMGTLASFYNQGIVTTVSINVDFMRHVLIEKDMYIQARADKLGRSIFFMSATIYQDKELKKPLARANGTFYPYK